MQYGRWLFWALSASSFACSYEFGGAVGEGGTGGNASSASLIVESVGTSNAAQANATADTSSTTGVAPDPLADCGFEDTFATKGAWSTELADVVNDHAETMVGLSGGEDLDAGFVSLQAFALADCFLSIRIDAPAREGASFLAVEDALDEEVAFEVQLGPLRDDGNGALVHGAHYQIYPGLQTSPWARAEHPEYLGLWLDGTTQQMRAFVRDGGAWVSLGAIPLQPYLSMARVGFGSFSFDAQSASDVVAIFDDLNLLPVTRSELESAQPMVVLDDDTEQGKVSGDG